jgi:hypothetical protein
MFCSAYHNFTSITTYSIALARAESHAALAVRNDPAEVKRRRAIARRACKRKEWDNTRRRTTPWQRYGKGYRFILRSFPLPFGMTIAEFWAASCTNLCLGLLTDLTH